MQKITLEKGGGIAMNTTSDYSDNRIRTELDYAEISTSILRQLTSVARKLFESAKHAVTIAVVVLVVSLVIFSLTKVVESEIVTAHYCDAITKVILVQ